MPWTLGSEAYAETLRANSIRTDTINSVTSTELSHLSGTTSSIQTQLNGKQELGPSKVYYHAELTNDITYNNNIYALPQDVKGMTLHGESHSGSYDTTTGIFTAPRSGLYYVDFTALVEDHVGTPRIFVLVCRMDYKPVGGSFTQHTGNLIETSRPRVSNTVSSAIYLNSGDQIKNVFQVTYESDSNTAHGTKLLAAYNHPTQSARDGLRATRQSVFSID